MSLLFGEKLEPGACVRLFQEYLGIQRFEKVFCGPRFYHASRLPARTFAH